jgi:hypothetical protein
MSKINYFLILILIVSLLVSIFFISRMNNFDLNSRDCENNGGFCVETPCKEIGMENHVDGICKLEKGKVYEDVLFCCTKRWD